MEIFIELSIILVITTVVATIMRLLKQPLVVGYIISGIVVGPYVLNTLHANESVELFSKIGIAILLFIVGLNLNPDTIKETGKPALVTGIGQIVFTSVIGYLIITALGYPSITAFYGAVALTFSSTIIVLKLLSDRGDLESLYGKISIGFLLVQDIAATLLLIIVPIIGAQGAGGTSTDTGLMLARLIGSGIGASIVLYIIAKFILPKFSDYLARSSELLFIFAISWGLVLATLFYKMGFSIEIGALIAGTTLAASKYSYEISSRMRPLRDFFVVMFFVLLGSHLKLDNIGALIGPALILSGYVLIGNPLIMFTLMNLMGYKNRTSFMAGLTVAQISEFSLILMSLGLTLGHIDQSAVTLITLVGIITIIGSTYFFLSADTLFGFLEKVLKKIAIRKKPTNDHEISQEHYDIIIFGFGRVGLDFVEKAHEEHLKPLVVDYNPEVFNKKKEYSFSHVFGDAQDVEFLEEIGVGNAKMIISTIPDAQTNELIITYYRQKQPNGIIITTAHTVPNAMKLYGEGATYVILPHYLGAYHATAMITKGLKDQEVFFAERKLQEQQIKKHHPEHFGHITA